MRAEKQHVECRGHALILFGQWGKQARDIAAQLGTAAATGFGQKAEQLPQADDPRGMDDLPSLPRRLGQPGTFERGQMK